MMSVDKDSPVAKGLTWEMSALHLVCDCCAFLHSHSWFLCPIYSEPFSQILPC